MQTFNRVGVVAGILFIIGMFVACTENNKFIGFWRSSVPTILYQNSSEVSYATSRVSIEFSKGESLKSGPFKITTLIDVYQRIENDTTRTIEPYEVNIASTASISGTWQWAEKDDNDDLILSFDMNTLQVEVNSDAVTFSKNIHRAVQEPELGILSDMIANRWENQITKAVVSKLANYSVLEDVEVSNDGNILTFEVKNVNGGESKMAFQKPTI